MSPATSSPRRPWRIACVSETYPPEVNGVATTFSRIVEGLCERGHRVQLVRPRQEIDAPARPRPDGGEPPASAAPLDELLLTHGTPIPRYPHLRMGFARPARLAEAWQRWRPDLVHIATEGPLGWAALRAACALGLPVTSDFRTNFHAYSGHYGIGWLKRPIEAWLRAFHNATARTMVPTQALRDELAAGGFERLHVVARGVDVGRFDPALRSPALRAAWGADEHTPVLLCVGRLAPEKNLDVLLALFERACAAAQAGAGRPPRLVLVGDGPLRASLQARCPQAVFAGQRRGLELAQHYASADLFVFPSLTETFGNVTVEAMASGLPVVAFDYAAAGQVITHGGEGLLARCGDAEALAGHALRLLGDDAARRAMAQAARRRALELDWPRIVDQFEAVLAQALDPREAWPGLAAQPQPLSG